MEERSQIWNFEDRVLWEIFGPVQGQTLISSNGPVRLGSILLIYSRRRKQKQFLQHCCKVRSRQSAVLKTGIQADVSVGVSRFLFQHIWWNREAVVLSIPPEEICSQFYEIMGLRSVESSVICHRFMCHALEGSAVGNKCKSLSNTTKSSVNKIQIKIHLRLSMGMIIQEILLSPVSRPSFRIYISWYFPLAIRILVSGFPVCSEGPVTTELNRYVQINSPVKGNDTTMRVLPYYRCKLYIALRLLNYVAPFCNLLVALRQ